MDYRTSTIGVGVLFRILRIDYVKDAIRAVRNAIPHGAIEAEHERLKNGSQLSIA